MEGSKEKRRLFIGINLPDECSERLEAMARDLGVEGCRIIPARNLHLTLRFIGFFEEEKLPSLEKRLRRSFKGFHRFSLEVGGWGAFPSPRRARILWAGVTQGAEDCHKLWWEAEKAVRSFGFEEENRFHPHVTVGRIRNPHSVEKYLEIPVSDAFCQGFAVKSIVLFESNLSSQGAEYTRLLQVPLEDSSDGEKAAGR